MSEILGFNDDFETGRVALNNAFSGVATFNTVVSTITYGITVSGNTIYSGASDLSYIFAPITAAANPSPFSGNTINGAILPVLGSNKASGSFSFVAGGKNNLASGAYSHAEGFNTSATTIHSHTEGYKTVTKGFHAHAEGFNTSGNGTSSHAEGNTTLASGIYSHSEGQGTKASNQASHAEGLSTIASGIGSHTEGSNTLASVYASHAEGAYTTASGYMSHAGGSGSTAGGQVSFIHSSNSFNSANNASILGGFRNRLNVAATGSTILGGSNITGSTADTVYVPNLTATTSIYATNFFSGNTNLATLISQGTSYSSGTTTAFSLESGYTGGASYRKDSNGYVYFKGVLVVGSIAGNNEFAVIPSGFRPSQAREFAVAAAAGVNGGIFICVINTGGSCQIVKSDGSVLSNGDNAYLDGVSYYIYD